MKFSVVIPTRGDVDLSPILASYEDIADEVLVWNNAEREDDLSVYARYATIAETRNDLVMTQDDDCVLPPESIQALIDRWEELAEGGVTDVLVANQPAAFRHDFYSDHCLVGFGAVFHRDLPEMAFRKVIGDYPSILASPVPDDWPPGLFLRTCDIVFTALTPRVLVDVPYENLPWAEDESRMYRSEGHVGERTRMLELVRQVRDA